VLNYRALPLLDALGFVVLLFSLGYVALQIVFTSERRLLSIETELETARQIQSSILPASIPELKKLADRGFLPSHDCGRGRFLPVRPH
jgi:hypothetical protein